jgi:hypothetical protein
MSMVHGGDMKRQQSDRLLRAFAIMNEADRAMILSLALACEARVAKRPQLTVITGGQQALCSGDLLRATGSV